MSKKITCLIEYASIFHDPRWLCEIRIGNFNSKRSEDNKNFINDIKKLIDKYNDKTSTSD